ncbi:hypothetical protein BBO99_00002661 [Phytophthora kernoviae]|uniref:Uncharacterized protein n=2 Tax=Phytophthora kernoviae TaxID=325452 RepID=A0A3R7JTS2_9STRA|nr:hypothetical protein G195_004541 [Phytophthora kernoviae 00238/432]KAG2526931.1 hypothetical protein JM16_002753 [Phytophthora kernoviae]KAG2528441.1 hypothetical protein JM18_002635 [Phytophthora kernoviae]RLN14142.1 hypothetical protein BBI17_002605 [Phytophthora kernoviae]RLN82775.1 hypothetical protein BBO99_00002661 [Phytophthora kernoviae]
MGREHYDKDRKSRKHSKKSSSSSRKASRQDKDQDKDREDRSSRHKHRHHHKSSRRSDEKLPGGACRISEDDYFLRATEFRVWLTQSKGKYVDDLSTEEATQLFRDDFVRKWNRGKLAEMFYKGLPDAVLEQTKRTRHRWGFVAKLGEKEKFALATAKDSVDVATKKQDLLNPGNGASVKKPPREKAETDRSNSRRKGREEEDKEDTWKRRKVERKKEKEYRDTVMDELAPKETGREAQIQKRRQLGEKLHGAARDREDTRDGLDVSEDFLMGGGRHGGEDDFQRRMAQRDSARRRKQGEQQAKLAGLAAKESARMDKFLEDMGLAGANTNGRKPMTIAPRR